MKEGLVTSFCVNLGGLSIEVFLLFLSVVILKFGSKKFAMPIFTASRGSLAYRLQTSDVSSAGPNSDAASAAVDKRRKRRRLCGVNGALIGSGEASTTARVICAGER